MKILHSSNNFLVSTSLKDAPAIAGASLEKIKEIILGKKYNLSLVFVGDKKIKKLNSIYRDKNSVTDILSFEISKEAGEIFINPEKTKFYPMKWTDFHKRKSSHSRNKISQDKLNSIPHFLIHGCLHLKGLSHGSRMNSEEKRLSKRFKLKVF